MLLPLLLVGSALAAANPVWNGHEPAHQDYRATEEDFRMFERGLAETRKIAPTLFPRGIVDIDAVLYDTHDLYIYSRSTEYPLPKFRRSGRYQVYRVPQGRPVQEHEMAICAGRAGPASVDVLRTITERSFACAAWGSFHRIQKERRSMYRFVEAYWATMIHEYGHQYRDLLSGDPTPEILAIDEMIAAAKLSEGTDRARAADEGFATWCELTAAKRLYPRHYRRMLAAAKATGDDDYDGHDAGLRAAVRLDADGIKGHP